MLAFGPVPSRRFGRSLGVNNIPPKRCSYSCVYCQLGPTRPMRIRPRPFLPVREVVSAVRDRVAACRACGELVDFVTVVPDGEPTLDLLLGPELRGFKQLGIPVAVITNGSLLWRPEVRASLAEADVVSVKVDTTDPHTWRRINRPGRQLRLPAILQGLEAFAQDFSGELWTETMLVEGINDDSEELRRTASFLEGVHPRRAYVAAPTRPPAAPGVGAPSTRALVEAHQTFNERLPEVRLLVSPEEGAFGHGGDPVGDLLAILQVHPMPERVARAYLSEAGAGPAVLDELLSSDLVVGVGFRGERFVVARLQGVPRH
jgi:wyosine [tRNA(Phe)-imidazoG37] synthetase (radical SAM superfamily)